MKKSFSVNIGYRLFNIDEDAYELLSEYLAQVRSRLGAEETDEVIRDIEIRIAELLSDRTGDSRQVVVLSDVEYVIGELGEPEQIGDSPEGSESTKQETKDERRLYRDTDDRILGGVCAGLGGFFDIDTLWVRIAFVVLFLLGGSGLLIYLILWLVVPAAVTSADKLRMKGKKVNVNNLSSRIRDEFDHVRNTFRSRKGKSDSSASRKTTSASGHSIIETPAFRSLIHAGAVVFGLFLIGFALMLLAGFIIGLFSDYAFWGHMHTNASSAGPLDLLFTVSVNPVWGWIGLFSLLAVIFVPLISMIIGGLRMIFRFRFPRKWFNRIVISLWGLSFGVLVTVIIFHTVHYSRSVYDTRSQVIPRSNATILFDFPATTACRPIEADHNGNLMIQNAPDGTVQFCAYPELEFVPELYDTLIRMQTNVRHSGSFRSEPVTIFIPEIIDSAHVMIKPYLPLSTGSISHVSVNVFIPVGKTIMLSETIRQWLYRNNRLDHIHLNQTYFTMTREGLRPGTVQ